MFKQEKCVPCQGGIPPLRGGEIKKYQKLISGEWLVDNDIKLIKEFTFTNYVSAVKFVNLVADLAEDQGHHPYIHLNYKSVQVILFTHKINGLHENDFLMASKIDKLNEKYINSRIQ